MDKLTFEFWNRHPSHVAAELIGCTLTRTQASGAALSGRIIETEAYDQSDPACHAFGFENREKTDRVAHFFGPAGVTYVYLNYGIHKLLNVISGPDENGSAVLIRAIEPMNGIKQMRDNRNYVDPENLCNGPGKLTQAFGINLSHNKIDLCRSDSPFVFAQPLTQSSTTILRGPRVGITKAMDLQWRFAESNNPNISKAKENKLLVPFKPGTSNR